MFEAIQSSLRGDRHHAKRLRILDRAGGGPTSSGWRLRVPLRGVIVGESEGAVRFRVGEGWDIDIYKPMILAVEQDSWASIIMN